MSKQLAIVCLLCAMTAAAATERLVAILSATRLKIETSEKAKQPSLAIFQRLVNKQFLDPAVVKSPRLAEATQASESLARYFVRLDRLLDYHPSDDPAAFLNDVPEVVFVIRMSGNPVSTCTLRRSGNYWKASTFGSTKLAEQIDNALKVVPNLTATQPLLLVDVPGIGVGLIGHVEHGELLLTPFKSNSLVGLELGKTAPAQEVFAKLSKVAKQFQ